MHTDRSAHIIYLVQSQEISADTTPKRSRKLVIVQGILSELNVNKTKATMLPIFSRMLRLPIPALGALDHQTIDIK